MRELKFRAWDSKNNVMHDEAYLSGRDTVTSYLTVGDSLGNYLDSGRMILMQYTGLKDRNGVEIYEGDIVNFTYWWFDGNPAESNLCGEIVYIEGCMSFGLKHVKNSDWCKYTGADREVGDTDAFDTWLFDEADFEVIGNIYENPELLGNSE